MPIPPPPPLGPPPPHTFSQLNAAPPRLDGEDVGRRGGLLSDICRGTKLRKVEVNDRSAPQVDSKTPTPPTEHPYFRLYQYLHQSQQGAPSHDPRRTEDRSAAPPPQKSRGGGGSEGANRSTAGSPSGSAQPIGDGLSRRSASTRAAAPRPPTHRGDDPDRPLPPASSPTDSCSHRPPPPNVTSSSLSPSKKHPPSTVPPPPPSHCPRGNTTPTSSYNREKPLPPTPSSTPPLPSKPPPSPNNSRRPPTSGGNPTPTSGSSLAPPPPPYCISNGPAVSGDPAPELPQRHNSLSNKRTAPLPGSHTPTRGPAPLPPSSPSQLGTNRPPPTTREGSGRDTAPPLLFPSPASLRVGGREAPPPPPYRTHGSPSRTSDPPVRGKPPPPPSRTPAAPPPPPPHRNAHPPSPSITCSFVDDFESRYSFHALDDFPPPDEYRHFSKIYPSRANRVLRGAPPLPPVGR